MFMEGDVDWVLVLGLIAAVTTVVAVLSLAYAWTHRERHVTTADELSAVARARQEAETRLYETLNAIPVALVQTDRGGKFVFANRAAHQLLGRKDNELIGLRFHSATWGITYPDGRQVPPDLLPSARALRGQTVKGFQHILANPATRRKMLVSVTAMPIEDALGQIIGSTAAIVETEGLTTPEVPPIEPTPALPDPNETTRRVFEAAASALVVIAPNGVIKEANRTALACFGLGPDVVGLDFADHFMAEAERVECRQALRAAAGAVRGERVESLTSSLGGPRGFGWRVLPLARPDGVVDALLLAGDPLSDPIEIMMEAVPEPAGPMIEDGLSGIEAAQAVPAEREAALVAERDAAVAAAEAARDEARRALERSEAAHRLESVGRLTGGVAQDFNALLTVMTGALDMLLKSIDDPARVRRLGEAALAAGQKGEVLTRRIAAFSQGEAAEARDLDAGVLLRAMETRIRALAGPGVDLMMEAPRNEAPVRVDPVGFEGAVMALVRNAVEAVGGAGAVAVRLELLQDEVRLTVRDTGPGLDEATAARALEPFFTTRPGQAGLGLAQVQAFARLSAGQLALKGDPEGGTEATLTLPLVGPVP
ncbi:histidine kinase [Brevundimonas sp. AAP58]|uniref:PAS domain-containing sensor histidine kinase n=1 Tax=Brevundimonas sp. AAP58 TaxID=1523422 RepID=UPI0006B8E793|nr:ATP-binding protein [Brevundimonas sp. AAP58]KPF83012.1 histidine kinase [Brevundimonas sp. AAP58]